MADILVDPMEICLGSFTVTSTTLAAATSPLASVVAQATWDATLSSGRKSKTHPPKPNDLVQGMERVIDMMEETFQICERAQRSMQDAPHHRTFPFSLRSPSSGKKSKTHPPKPYELVQRMERVIDMMEETL
jgi:predicted transcriptional regulator